MKYNLYINFSYTQYNNLIVIERFQDDRYSFMFKWGDAPPEVFHDTFSSGLDNSRFYKKLKRVELPTQHKESSL